MNLSIFLTKIQPIRDKLYRFAWRITGNRHDAEDVVQEVFEKIWKTKEENNTEVLNWEAWCMTMTRNRALDKTRSLARRRTEPIERRTEKSDDIFDPETALESDEIINRVRNMINLLPEKQKMVIHLRDIEEMSYEEIAKMLEMSMEQVKVNIHRGRKTLREKLIINGKPLTINH